VCVDCLSRSVVVVSRVTKTMKQQLGTRLLLRDKTNTTCTSFVFNNYNSSSSNMDRYDDDWDGSLPNHHGKQTTTTAGASSTTTLKRGSVIRDSGSSTPQKNERTSTSRHSQSIPLPRSHVHRTQSEVQLCEDMETAERRDLTMFYRLVNGIRERQMQLLELNDLPNSNQDTRPTLQEQQLPRRRINPPYSNYDPTTQYYLGSQEAESCVAHIIHTRNNDTTTTTVNNYALLPSMNNSNSVPIGCAMSASATLQQALLNQGSTSDPKRHPKEDNALGEWWSLSGFDEEAAPLSNSNNSRQQLQQHSSFTTMEDCCGAKDDEDDEGIFDLDF
jgi:hypothetical protein